MFVGNPENLVILLDADGVLFDFDTGSARVHGVRPKMLQDHRTPGVWDTKEPLGTLVLGRPFSTEEFWRPITSQKEEFWENLDPLPWWKELIQLVEKYTTNWHIVSAPSRCPTSYNGKVRAFKRLFGQDFDRFLLTPHKELLARPNSLLIDDRESNVEKFVLAGGLGLTFASLGNSLHAFRDDPISHLSDSLRSLLGE